MFSLGQHPALVEVQRQLVQGEHLFAYLDDIYVVTEPERVRTVLTLVENALLAWAGISIHQEKTKIWNQAGFNLLGVRCWKGWQGSWTNMRTCGEVQNCPHICKESKFWAHRLVTLNMCGRTWTVLPRPPDTVGQDSTAPGCASGVAAPFALRVCEGELLG